MSDQEIKKEDLFTAIKHGHLWPSLKIKEELENIMNGDHSFRWDSEDKYHYVYDNECYIFVGDKKIDVRCDRENVFSSNVHIEYDIKSEADIKSAYELFKSMTMECEED